MSITAREETEGPGEADVINTSEERNNNQIEMEVIAGPSSGGQPNGGIGVGRPQYLRSTSTASSEVSNPPPQRRFRKLAQAYEHRVSLLVGILC